MRLSGQFQFFYEKILRVKKAPKHKIKFFPFSEVFLHKKLLPLLFFVRLILFCYLLLARFAFLCTQTFFTKNWNCLNKLMYYTTDLYAAQPAYREFICKHLFFLWSLVSISSFYGNLFYLWESLLIARISIICVNLCLYENKQTYKYQHLKQIFFHQKQIMMFSWFQMFQVCVFYFELFLFYVWILFY